MRMCFFFSLNFTFCVLQQQTHTALWHYITRKSKECLIRFFFFLFIVDWETKRQKIKHKEGQTKEKTRLTRRRSKGTCFSSTAIIHMNHTIVALFQRKRKVLPHASARLLSKNLPPHVFINTS